MNGLHIPCSLGDDNWLQFVHSISRPGETIVCATGEGVVFLTPDTARQLRDYLSAALGEVHQPVAPIPPGTVKCAEGLGKLTPCSSWAREAAGYANAAEAVLGFDWGSTTEGPDFWAGIFHRLAYPRDLAEAAARRPKVPEPVSITSEWNIGTRISISDEDGLVVLETEDGMIPGFSPAQAREAAAALVKMADALEGSA